MRDLFQRITFGCILIAPSAHAGQCDPSMIFQETSRAGLGQSPSVIAAADLNGDGVLDLVSANFDTDDVSVLLGNGDGTFQPDVRYGAGDEPDSIAVADLNGDSAADLIVANMGFSGGGNDISVLLGNGDGTFQNESRFGVGTNPRDIALGDLDGNGTLDAVVANWGLQTGAGDDNISVLLGNGDGTFQSEQRYTTGDKSRSVTIADFNADGALDAAVANEGDPFGNAPPDDVSVLLGNGDGTFQNQARFIVGNVPYAIAAGDLNGDGNVDLAAASSGGVFASGALSVLLGNGNGTFQAASSVAAGSSPVALAIGDLNNDATPDIAVTNASSNDMSILVGVGDGTFLPEARYAAGGDSLSIVIADLDGAGQPDLALALTASDEALIMTNLCNLFVSCTGDCNSNGVVDFQDLISMLFRFGDDIDDTGCDPDGDGTVTFSDLVASIVLYFGPCP